MGASVSFLHTILSQRLVPAIEAFPGVVFTILRRLVCVLSASIRIIRGYVFV